MWKSFYKTVYFRADKRQSFVDNRNTSKQFNIFLYNCIQKYDNKTWKEAVTENT